LAKASPDLAATAHAMNVNQALAVLSLVPLCLYIGKAALCRGALVQDMSAAPPVGAIACGSMASCLVGIQVFARLGSNLAFYTVTASFAAHVFIMLHFLRLVWVGGLRPEPFWFPPTVGFAVFAVGGAHTCWRPELSSAILAIAAAYTVLLLPPVAFRVARDPGQAAPGPAVGILAAPAALICSMWHLTGRPTPLEGEANVRCLGLVLYAASNLFFLQTLVAIMQRRANFMTFVPPFTALTFPLSSVTRSALWTYSEFDMGDTALAFALALFVFCNLVTGAIGVGCLVSMPKWTDPGAAPPVPMKAINSRLLSADEACASGDDAANMDPMLVRPTEK